MVTDQNEEVRIVEVNRVQVVALGRTYEAPFHDFFAPDDDARVISDELVLQRAASFLARGGMDEEEAIAAVRNHVVSRPETGNILVSPKPRFGAGNSYSSCSVLEDVLIFIALLEALVVLGLLLFGVPG